MAFFCIDYEFYMAYIYLVTIKYTFNILLGGDIVGQKEKGGDLSEHDIFIYQKAWPQRNNSIPNGQERSCWGDEEAQKN